MIYFLCLIFGTLPSFIWLLFYLRKDSHPESNGLVLRVFLCGIIMAAPAIFTELGFKELLEGLKPSTLYTILNTFIAIALVEELAKYYAVRIRVLKNEELDEPLDAMLYMIIAALGFAAAENTLILFSLGPDLVFGKILVVSILRFWGATFLHALTSGVIGYFLALSFYETKKRNRILILGIILATLLHGLYNFSIMELQGSWTFLIPIAILISLAGCLAPMLKRLKKMKSVCKI